MPESVKTHAGQPGTLGNACQIFRSCGTLARPMNASTQPTMPRAIRMIRAMGPDCCCAAAAPPMLTQAQLSLAEPDARHSMTVKDCWDAEVLITRERQKAGVNDLGLFDVASHVDGWPPL